MRKILNLIFSKAFEKLVLKKKLFRIVKKKKLFFFLINLPEFLKTNFYSVSDGNFCFGAFLPVVYILQLSVFSSMGHCPLWEVPKLGEASAFPAFHLLLTSLTYITYIFFENGCVILEPPYACACRQSSEPAPCKCHLLITR